MRKKKKKKKKIGMFIVRWKSSPSVYQFNDGWHWPLEQTDVLTTAGGEVYLEFPCGV